MYKCYESNGGDRCHLCWHFGLTDRICAQDLLEEWEKEFYKPGHFHFKDRVETVSRIRSMRA